MIYNYEKYYLETVKPPVIPTSDRGLDQCNGQLSGDAIIRQGRDAHDNGAQRSRLHS